MTIVFTIVSKVVMDYHFLGNTHQHLCSADSLRAISQSAGQFCGGSPSSDAHPQKPLHREPDHLRHVSVPHLHAFHISVLVEPPVDAGPRTLQVSACRSGHKHHGVRRDYHSHRRRQVKDANKRINKIQLS